MESPAFDAIRFDRALRLRLTGNSSGYTLMEALINHASIHASLLQVRNIESISFIIARETVRPLSEPEFHRLVLVLPEAFEVTWKLQVSGFFRVRHTNLSSAIPYHVPPVQIKYSAVLIPAEDLILFKNEQVMLI